MSKPQTSFMEVTRALRDRAKATGFSFGEDTALVAVQHMLLQTVDLFRTVGDMGLPLKNIFALGKIYSNSFPVISALRDMGVTVLDSTVPKPGEFHSSFQFDIKTLWKVASEILAKRKIERILVLDDAGVCITGVPAGILGRYAVCGVEQTTRGMVLFEETPPRFAVISWARAGVKLEIAGPIYSQYLIEKLNTKFPGESLQGDEVGIIGLGSIGRGVANLLLTQGNKIFFYDSNPDLHVPGSLRNKIVRVHSLEELLLHCDCVLGCSGRNPFKDKWPLLHRPGIKLVSASSGDQEFGPIIKDLRQKPRFKVASNTWDIVSEDGPSGPIHIAYLGYPYSFVSRAPEALPTRIAQLDTGGLLAALVQARMTLDLCEQDNRGIHRVSPEAQRFVYQSWLRAMNAHGISLDVFGYDLETVRAAQHDNWFIEKTEPHPNGNYTPSNIIEKRMARFLGFSL